jgi:putative hemolysin
VGTTTIILLIALVPLLVLVALCASAETALFSLTPSELRAIRARRPGVAEILDRWRARPRALLVTVLLLANASSVAFFVVSTLVSNGLAVAWMLLAFELATLLVLIFLGDLVPKLIARRRRVLVAPFIVSILAPVYRTISPLRAVLEHGVVVPLVRLIHPERAEKPPPVGPEELASLLEGGSAEAGLMQEEQWLLGAVVELGTIRVREVMSPRVDMPWVEIDAGPNDVMSAIGENASARYLAVCRGGIDGGVVGLLNVPQYLAVTQWAQARLGPAPAGLASFLDPVVFVPERARLDRVIDMMASQGCRLCICVSEAGAITGSISSEQALASLMATPLQPADTAAAQIFKVGEGTWNVPGRLGVRHLTDYLLGTAELAPGTTSRRVTSVAGLVIAALGRLPRVGEAVRVGPVRLRVAEMDERSVERIEVSLAGADVAAGTGGSEGAKP